MNLSDKFSQIHEHWKPHIAGELNGQLIKLVKFQGEFVWHHHDNEDEMFFVVKGRFRMEFRDEASAPKGLNSSGRDSARLEAVPFQSNLAVDSARATQDGTFAGKSARATQAKPHTNKPYPLSVTFFPSAPGNSAFAPPEASPSSRAAKSG